METTEPTSEKQTATAATSAQQQRRRRRAEVQATADEQGGVVSRAQVYAQAMTRGEVRAQVRAGRWQLVGRHCIATRTGPLPVTGTHWVAVLEAGPRALVDGESALVLAGLERYEPHAIRVSVPRGTRIRHPSPLVDIRQTRRWSPLDRQPGDGVPRTRPAVAAVRAGLWARSDRQATLLITMAVQQDVVGPSDLAVELLRVRRDRRRALVQGVLIDLVGGIGSLGELDVVRGCRERGLPPPECQAVHRTRLGTYYLDFRWPQWRVVVEVDGVQHAWAEQLVSDALRHNGIALSGDTVLRLPVVGLRLSPDAFFEQIEDALRAGGWKGPPDVIRSGCQGDQVA